MTMERPTTAMQASTAKFLWQKAAIEIYPSFREDAENKDVIRLLQMYMARDVKFEQAGEMFSLNKGLLLMGNYGSGKTLLMRVLQRAILASGVDLQFKQKNMQDLCSLYQDQGAKVFANDYSHWFIDEMGIINREIISHYGNKVNIGDEIIGGRYNLFKFGWRTHITTNLSEPELKDFYDGRTFSRIQEMCNIIPLTGKDRRFGAKPPEIKTSQQELPKHDQQQANREWWQMILRQHQRFIETGQLHIDGELRQWKLFEEAGIVKLNVAEKNDLMAQARQELFNELNESLPLEKKAREKAKSLRDSIASGQLKSDQQEEIRIRAVRNAIKNLYTGTSQERFAQLVSGQIVLPKK